MGVFCIGFVRDSHGAPLIQNTFVRERSGASSDSFGASGWNVWHVLARRSASKTPGINLSIHTMKMSQSGTFKGAKCPNQHPRAAFMISQLRNWSPHSLFIKKNLQAKHNTKLVCTWGLHLGNWMGITLEMNICARSSGSSRRWIGLVELCFFHREPPKIKKVQKALVH